MTETNVNTARSDIRNLAKDAQDLYREASDTAVDTAESLRSKGANVLNTVYAKAKNAQASVVGTSKDLVGTTDEYVQGNPWKAILISASVGVVAGVLLARK